MLLHDKCHALRRMWLINVCGVWVLCGSLRSSLSRKRKGSGTLNLAQEFRNERTPGNFSMA